MVPSTSLNTTRRAVCAAGALALTLALAGCASDASATTDVDTEAAVPLNMVVCVGTGARANTPALASLPSSLTTAIEETVSTGGSFDLVVLDGDPDALGASVLASDAATAENRESENATTAAAVATLVLEAQADDPECDLIAGLQTASNSLRAQDGFEGADNHIYLLDSLLATSGLLSYAEGSAISLSSDPTEVAAYVTEHVRLDLTDIVVDVYFAGEVDGDQEEPTDEDIQRLEETLELIVANAGGEVVFHTDQVSKATEDTSDELPEVSVCPVSTVASFSAETVVYDLDASCGVSFDPNTATFSDEDAARETIATVAQTVVARELTVKVEGSCASVGTTDDRAELALARAEVVAAMLREEGVADDQISSVAGLADGFVDDRDDTGALVPALAAQNRAVRVTVLT